MAFEYLPISEDEGASSIENVAVAGMMIHKVIPAQSIEGGMPITEDKGAGSIEAVAAGGMMIHKAIPAQSIEGGMPITEDDWQVRAVLRRLRLGK